MALKALTMFRGFQVLSAPLSVWLAVTMAMAIVDVCGEAHVWALEGAAEVMKRQMATRREKDGMVEVKSVKEKKWKLYNSGSKNKC